MKQLRKLLEFSWQQRRVLFYACLSLNIVRFALWLFPFKTVRQQLATVAEKWVCDQSQTSVSVDFIVWCVKASAYYTPRRSKCLVNALTAQLLLTRYQYAHQLHIGIAMDESQTLKAHAWIEYEGNVIIGDLQELSRYKSLSHEGVKI
ncbi:MAG: lasso peptide biosynthesis B2 protein [Cyanobacteria bacterium P01_H01_bin.21]